MEEKEIEVTLGFEKRSDGGIAVVALGKDGKKLFAGNLLYFTTNGEIYRCSSVNPDIGFRLGAGNRIITN